MCCIIFDLLFCIVIYSDFVILELFSIITELSNVTELFRIITELSSVSELFSVITELSSVSELFSVY